MNIRNISITLLLLFVMNMANAQNPFFATPNTPHGTFPFNELKTEHYEPAIREGMRLQKIEIDDICNNPAAPTFENTVLAYEKSGELLSNVLTVFGTLQGAETNDDMLALAQKLTPEMSKHGNDIRLNEKLFARIKAVYEQMDRADLNPEQKRLTDKIYKGFVRSGANLDEASRKQYRELSEKLSLLTLQYSQNNLKETNEYMLVVDDINKLAGLPESVLTAASETAKAKGVEGWAFTLQGPSYIPFMQYADNRDLRKELYMAYNTKCTKDNEYNNLDHVKEIANTRMQVAHLMGFKDFASYNLQERMAENSEAVYNLLNQLVDAYTPTAQAEVNELQTLARESQGNDFIVMPWDWAYYSNKLKDKKFNLNEEMLRPYFELENVKKGVFGLATQLCGITFKKNTDIPVYHEEVDAYEVFDKDGNYIAVLYTDFHPRAGKRAGAWMTEFKGQWKDEKTGENSRPHVSIVMNFTKPTEEKPALLSFDEYDTFLHEFGHALHGILANTTYESMSGTSVYRDFVELPSQLMQNYATEKGFLNSFAKHYQTGEVIPQEYIPRRTLTILFMFTLKLLVVN